MKWLNRGGDGPQAIAFFAVLVVFTFAPLTSNAASGTLENWWCSTTDFFGLPLCEQAPLVAVEASLPQAAEISDPVAVVAHTTVVEKFNTHVIEPASVITEGLVLGISNFVSLDSFRRQADAALGSAAKSARSVGSDMQAAQDGIKEQVTTVARTVSGTVNGAGTLVAGSLSASTPLASGAVSGTLGHWWCTATDFLGLSLCGEAPSLVVVVPQSQPVQTPAPEPSAVHTTVVEQHNTYVTKPTTIVRETSGRANSEVVSPDSFHRQVDVVFDNVADSLRGVRDDIQAVRTDIAESVITAVLEVSGNANVGGNLDVTGTLTAGSLSVSSVSSGGVVEAPYFTATSSTASTLPYASTTAITVSGTASTTNLIANNFTLGSLTGFLKATAGVIATSLINLASDVTGVLAAVNGGTGLSTITNNQLLIGGAGNTFTQIATSSLGLITTDVAEGSNLYYTTTRFDNRLSATTTLPNLTTLANLTTVSTGLTGILKATSGALSAVSTLVPGDISLTKGNFLVGNDAGVAQATSSIFISSTGNVGIGSTVPDALLDIVGTTASLKSLLRVEQYATAVGAYGLEIHTYADNGAAPTPGAGAQSGLVIHNYTDAAPAMIIDQTRSTPLLLLRNSANPLTSSGTKGTGSFLDFAGYGLTDPNTLTDLGQISNHLSFSSYDPLVKWTFATGLDVNAGLRASITTAGAPDTTGTSETNNILRLLSGSTAVSMDMGVNNSPAYSWLQSRARTNYATNYSLVLNPNGGNVGVGTTSPASTLGVQGNGLFSGNLAVAGLTATGTVTFSGLSTGIAHLSSTGVLSSSAVALGGSDVTGTLTVANGGTGATTLTGLLQGNGTSAITAVTGTAGQFPYYNGTNTLLATSTLFVSTASNVGIGLTSPSARLNVKSAAANNLGGFMLTASGSSNYPVLIFENSSNGGQIELRDGSNVLATRITTNADSYITGGNVGIGTTNPASHKLVVVGGNANSLRVDNAGEQYTSIDYFNNGSSKASTYYDNTAAQLILRTVSAADIGFDTNLTRRMTILAAGNVGVGSTTPYAKLSVKGAGTTTGVNFQTTNSSNSPLFTILDSGNVGIGVTNPASKLTVHVATDANFHVGTDGTELIFGAYNDAVSAYAPMQMYASEFNLMSGNVGIGTTTPTQLLHVYGSTPFINITPSSTGQLSGVRLTDSANSGKGGFYYDATNDLLRFARSISTSATNGLAIDSSGNVGIGTIAPQWQQEISGTGQNTSAITDSGDKTGALLLRSRNNGVDSGGALIFAGNNTAGAYFGAIKGLLADGTSQTLGSIAFSTRNGTSDTALTERMRVHYNGNVGIGNVSPGYKLTVTDTTADGIAGRFDQSATSGSPFGIYSTATGAATQNIAGYFSASGATANLGVFINAPTASANNYALYSAATAQSYFAGNVGIGSTNPGWKLTIATAAATPVRSLDISGSTTGFNYASMSNTSGSLWWGVEGSSAGQVFASSLAYASVIGSSNATALQLASNGTVRMTLDTSGNVGIGTTSPQDKLHVYDGTAAVGNAGIRAEGYVGGYGAGIEAGSQLIGGSYLAMGKAVWDGESSWNSTVSTQDSYFSLHTTENGTLGEKLRVTSSGNVGIGTASPTNKLHVYSTTGQTSHFGGQGLGVTSTNFTGISFGYGETGPTYQKSALVQEQVGDGAARGTIHILNDGTNDSSNATLADARLSITYAGNVGIGTTTPATKLDVNGGGRFLDYTIPGSGTGLEIAYDPSIPAGRIIAIDRTTSTFKPLRLQASSIILNGGSEGNVGIGTTNPSTKFVVSGGANGFEFVPGATASDSVFQVYDRVASSYGTMDVDVAKLNVRINGSGSALYVDGSGNVGIGTTNPSAPFEVSRILTNADWTAVKISNNGAWGTASGKYAQMLFTDGTNNVAGIGATYDGTYGRLDFNALYNAGSGSTAAVAMSIRGNGNVGIGATNPLAKLDVASGAIFLSNSYYAGALPAVSVTPLTGEIRGGENAASSYGFLRLSAGSTVGEQSAIDIVGYNSLATDAQLIRLITSGNERMRVTQSGNVGIGTTTPIVRLSIANNSADGLSITNTSQTANNKIFAIQNTGSTLRIAPLNDAGSATADGLQIDRSGNVGIGTTSPESKLTVTGAVSASGLITSYGTGESFRAGNGGVGPVSLRAVNTGNDVYFGSEGSTAGGFFTGSLAYSSVIYSNTAIQQIIGGTSRMIINTAGNVGIGTASPSYKLDVNGFVNTQGTYTVGGYKLNGYSVLADASGDILVGDIGNNYAGGVSIRTAGSERVYVKNTGNVGIGDTSPDAKLDILQSSDASTQGLQISRSNDSDYMRLYMSAGVGTLSDTLIFSSAFGGDVAAIGRDGSAYFAGNVGIGNANPQYKLDVHSGATAEAVNFYSTDTTVYNPAVFQGTSRLNLVSGGGVTGSHSLIRFSNAAGSVENFFGVVQESNTRGAFVWKGYNGTTAAYGEYMRIANDGNVGIGTASPGQKLDVAGTVRQTGGVNCALSSNASGDIICTSDANLKENIAPFADGLSIIKGIDPSYFQYKGENYTHVGFIAQNVKAVLPAAAPLQNNGFLGLDSNAILAAVVNAIKELSNHLDGLQATVLGFSDRFTTKTLCVGETCVTEDELKMLLQNANINVAASAASSVPEETTQATTTPEIIEVGTSATSTEATSTEATSTEATSTPSVEVPPVPVVLVQEDEVGQIHMSETTFTSTLPSNEVPTSQYISL